MDDFSENTDALKSKFEQVVFEVFKLVYLIMIMYNMSMIMGLDFGRYVRSMAILKCRYRI